MKDPTGRLGRWALRLQEYTFSVLYKSRRLHQDADSLSRHPVDRPDLSGASSDVSLFAISDLLNIAEEQRRDASLRLIFDGLESATPDPSLRAYAIRDGTLYYRNFRADGPELLLVIPQHLRAAILHQLHDVPTAGHLGITRTYDRVRRRFFWPGLYKSVPRYVTACDLCQRRKTPTTLPTGQLQPIEIPLEPFFCVGLDLLGPFPLSKS